MSLYATTAQIKAALRIPTGDTIDDALISLAGSAASELIDAYCGRVFGTSGTVATTRVYSTHKMNHVEVDDMASAPVFVKSSTSNNGVFDYEWAPTDYVLLPLNSFVDGLTWPYTAIQTVNQKTWYPAVYDEPMVQVSAIWGFPTVPSAVTQACVIQASRIFKRNDSPLGVAGWGDMGVMRVTRQVDADVEVLLAPYRRVRSAA
ncbi:gp6 domain containing protein [uncultured Caudovirales phage]|uniref:Gp6 domain containing protein n=1 Tax=uncultured Caudovirales phage TaxID=2100421 RepID=A0A6J7WIC8_9CAUD|nr:gp6 domain containing protein [uncultured Caudovirales phage]